ncbi:MAG: hypothetical protein ABIO72_02530 [Patescibacteria group bacterium]
MDLRDGPVDPTGKDLLSSMMTTEKARSSQAELREYMQLRAAGLLLAEVFVAKRESSEDDVVGRLDRKRAVEALESTIEGLDARSKQVVDLLYFQEVSLDEAALALGESRGKPYTKRHVSRLNEAVRAKLAEALLSAGITSAVDDADDSDDTEE